MVVITLNNNNVTTDTNKCVNFKSNEIRKMLYIKNIIKKLYLNIGFKYLLNATQYHLLVSHALYKKKKKHYKIFNINFMKDIRNGQL